jgi:hypothetical protein
VPDLDQTKLLVRDAVRHAGRGPDHSFDLRGRKPERSLKETLKSQAGDPKNPMKMDNLDLIVREYQFTGEWASARCSSETGHGRCAWDSIAVFSGVCRKNSISS